MPQFKFRLSTVLRIRETARDERRARLAEAYQAEQTLLERRGQIEQEMHELRTQGQPGAERGPVNVDRLLDAHRYELVLKAELHVLAQQASALAAEIEQRRQALVAADREVRVLERLRERQLERHQQHEALQELKRLDEFASRPSSTQEARSWAD